MAKNKRWKELCPNPLSLPTKFGLGLVHQITVVLYFFIANRIAKWNNEDHIMESYDANGFLGTHRWGCAHIPIVRRKERRVNTRKAVGPDGISGRVLKSCATQLALVLTTIFNLSLAKSVVPACFKRSIIVPVPENASPAGLNDYRPDALISVVMKCFERLVKEHICAFLPRNMDPLQFAYCPNRSTDEAVSQVLHTALSHLDSQK
ncbi:uncharacterized protein LOC129706765 [Leucoraja erinacea]|uniref:uncharacterized protein LOC129706765 n=1 Tax=Leucoraja erinaceus TaxID=7782 RepID=UPI00245490D4|nr:uncharacterized protein LOC129706765 [Leucoraja erinacea]